MKQNKTTALPGSNDDTMEVDAKECKKRKRRGREISSCFESESEEKRTKTKKNNKQETNPAPVVKSTKAAEKDTSTPKQVIQKEVSNDKNDPNKKKTTIY